jgi:anti-sigma regulatory factor (Ser/Thr protein kinase)
MARTFTAENTVPSICALIAEAVSYLRAEGVASRPLFVSELVLEEMLTNIVKYSFDDDLPHHIEVTAETTGDSIRLELRDDGHVFDPTLAPEPKPGTPLSEMKVGGRGISLVRKFSDEIEYRRENDWNILRIRFSGNRAAAA